MSHDALFPGLPEDSTARLATYNRLLQKVFPVKGKHRKELPRAIADLSATLTMERSGRFKPDYMSQPRLFGAYLYYFHAWNLVRLGRLMAGLRIDLPAGSSVLDLGSGPLTAVQALWLARPDLRDKEIDITCLDLGRKALEAGRNLFFALAGESPWRIRTIVTPVTTRERFSGDLVIAANVVNEMISSRRSSADLAEGLARRVNANGSLLLVEPGLRSGGRIVAEVRDELVAEGLSPLAPCTHAAECPMESGRPRWCHFNFDESGAPEWLARLSREAQLPKTGLSLSFLHAGKFEAGLSDDRVRIISEDFELPDGERGQYACSAHGLVLVKRPGVAYSPGTVVTARWPEEPEQDPKSGAIVLPWTAFE